MKKKLTSLVLVAFLLCTVFGSPYEYIKNGVGVVDALTPTTLTITTSSAHPAANHGFTLSGTLKSGSIPLSGKKITLGRTDPSGAYSQPKSTTTNANGVYTFPRSESQGVYRYTAIFSGDTCAPSLASVKLTVGTLTPTTLTITTSSANPAANQSFTLSGTLKAGSIPLSGKKITLGRTDPSGAYSQPKSTTTNANGVYTFPRSESQGVYRYTAIFSGDTYAPSLASFKLTVGNLQKSTISIVPTKLTPAVKQSYTLHGVLQDGVSGAPLAGQPILLNVRLPSGKNVGMSATTNTNGAYTFTRSESARGSYAYSVSFWGNSHYSGSSTMLELNIGNPKPTTLSLKITDKAPDVNQPFTISGYLTDIHGTTLPHRALTVPIRLPTGSWISVQTATDSNGRYSVNFREQAAGQYRFEVHFMGDGTYAHSGTWALVAVSSLQATKISMTTTVTNPGVGESFTLSGKLTDANGKPLLGKGIDLYQYVAGQINPPNIFQTRYTDKNGYYHFVLKITSGTYIYTARFTGDQTYTYSQASVKLTVG